MSLAGQMGLRRPAEFEPHARTWMAWPHRPFHYRERLPAIQRAVASVAQAISEFEPVSMIVHPGHYDLASAIVGTGINLVTMACDDFWLRDSGPTFMVGNSGQIAGISWVFNAWGGKSDTWADDAEVARSISSAAGAQIVDSWLTTEGGALCVDGDGTLVVTETSLLNPNRNAGVGKASIERELKSLLGVTKVIWVPGDPLEGVTNGHVDLICCFATRGRLLVSTNPDLASPRGRILDDNRRILAAQTDAKGRVLEIIEVPEAHDIAEGPDVCRSYINMYLVNGGVVLPAYGSVNDAVARDIIARAFPDRRVVQVDVIDIARNGGSIHCITQEEPGRAG